MKGEKRRRWGCNMSTVSLFKGGRFVRVKDWAHYKSGCKTHKTLEKMT